jgi:hypothetical protein
MNPKKYSEKAAGIPWHPFTTLVNRLWRNPIDIVHTANARPLESSCPVVPESAVAMFTAMFTDITDV